MQPSAFLERKLWEGRFWKAGGGGSLGIPNTIFARRVWERPTGSWRLRPPVTACSTAAGGAAEEGAGDPLRL